MSDSAEGVSINSNYKKSPSLKKGLKNSQENQNSGNFGRIGTDKKKKMQVNDGIRPKIFITTVPEDVFDSQYANAGYDEEIEKKLHEECA